MIGLFYDPTIWIFFVALAISSWAQFKVTSTFNKYANVQSAKRTKAEDVSREILRINGIAEVHVEGCSGKLTDHYNPKNKTIRLSESVYNSSTIAAVAVAAHETGHALQDFKGYSPLKIRNAIVPIANIASSLSIPLLILGIILSSTGLIYVGIITYFAVLAFQLITLPVEFNASKRAIVALSAQRMLEPEEVASAKKVLSAAALTYVAAALTSLLTLLRFILIARSRR